MQVPRFYLNEENKTKLFFALIIAAIFIALFMLFNLPETKDPRRLSMEYDNDNDGVPNGIEEIIGTNQNRVDSDGDGYADLEELKNGFNPAGKSKGDKYSDSGFTAIKERIKELNAEFYSKNFE